MVIPGARSAFQELRAERFTCAACRIAYSLHVPSRPARGRLFDEEVRIKVRIDERTYCLPCAEDKIGRRLLDSDFVIDEGVLVLKDNQRQVMFGAYTGRKGNTPASVSSGNAEGP